MKVLNSGERIYMVGPGVQVAPGQTVEIEDSVALKLIASYPELKAMSEPVEAEAPKSRGKRAAKAVESDSQ